MNRIALVLIVSVTLTATLATIFSVWREEDSARAIQAVVLGFDMDPYNSPANSCPGDGATDCTLGSIEQCISVSASEGTTFEIDAFVDDLWQGYGGFNWELDFPDTASPANLTMINQTEGSGAINLIMQSPGSELLSLSEAVPDVASPHSAGVTDFGTKETTPPFTQGTLARYEFTVGASATPDYYYFSFVAVPFPTYAVLSEYGVNYSDLLGITVLDANSTPQYGLLALGQACPAVTVTPTPTVSPTPTATVSPTPTPTGTPSPGTVPLVTGWNDSCYQGHTQPIGDAFASIVANVQAVYRMKADQTFDRWFPARADLSTITILNPFDQLFTLMTDNAVWMIEPVAQPPSSATLRAGWNSICYLGGGKDTAAAAAGISGAFSIMYNLGPDQVWRRYVPGVPELSNLARLETFTSVLILMTDPEGGTWAFSP